MVAIDRISILIEANSAANEREQLGDMETFSDAFLAAHARQLLPLMLDVVKTQTGQVWNPAKAIYALDALNAYCANHLPERT